MSEAPLEEDVRPERPPSPASPVPNCAICLEPYNNKSMANCCQHQFCFDCLLQWSKVKAECPLCKKSFRTITHTMKSKWDYKEFRLAPPTEEIQLTEDIVFEEENMDDLYLPNGPAPPHRRYRFRTTFTVDPRRELAIQQFFLSHPLTNTVYSIPMARNDGLQDVNYRRYIYRMDMWVDTEANSARNFTSPDYFRDQPNQMSRVAPWLRRELNALLHDEPARVIFNVFNVIIDLVRNCDVRSSRFRNSIVQYLGDNTEHFIHEFYMFLRSPFDMNGYDRFAAYRLRSEVQRPETPQRPDSPNDCIVVDANPSNDIIVIDSDTDSDVLIIEPDPPPTIEVLDSNEEEPVDDAPLSPLPSASVDQQRPQKQEEAPCSSGGGDNAKPCLPIKIRLKSKSLVVRKRQKKVWQLCDWSSSEDEQPLQHSSTNASSSRSNNNNNNNNNNNTTSASTSAGTSAKSSGDCRSNRSRVKRARRTKKRSQRADVANLPPQQPPEQPAEQTPPPEQQEPYQLLEPMLHPDDSVSCNEDDPLSIYRARMKEKEKQNIRLSALASVDDELNRPGPSRMKSVVIVKHNTKPHYRDDFSDISD